MIDPEGTSHLKKVLKDLLCGSFAGILLTLSGHPFDSIKVRMQTSSPPIGLSKCISTTMKKEGLLGFYRGLTPPLSTVPFVNAIVMTSYEFCKRFLGVESEEEFTLGQSIASVELVKCRLQVQTESAADAYYKGSIDCAVKVVQEEGIKTLMTSGLIATILRETCCYTGQFGGYFLAKRTFAKLEGCNVTDLSHFSLFMSGGIGGLFCWLASYPQDIVKTKLQTQPVGIIKYPRHNIFPDEGIISCSKEIWASEGFIGFWRGFSACSIRAFWANACMFSAYEFAMSKIDYLIE